MSMKEMNDTEAWEEELPFTEPAPEPDIWDEGERSDQEEADFWEEDAEEAVEDADAYVEENTDARIEETVNQQAFIDAEVCRQMDAMIAQQWGDYVNPYTGRAITTKAEWDNYQRAFAEDEKQKRLQAMGISQEMLDQAVSEHPAIRQAQEILQRQQQDEANNLMNREFAALQKEFPDCGLNQAMDLMKTEAGRKTLQLWSKTELSMADAYAAAHRTELKQKQNTAVRQGVLNQMNGKKHLTQTKSGSQKTEMPEAIRMEYKKYFPNASDAEIKAMYLKNRASE